MKSITTSIFGLGLAASLVLAGPAAAQNCASFQGIDHCPVGDAVLDLSEQGLSVSGLGSEGNDGVASNFGTSTVWNAQAENQDGSDFSARLSAVSDGSVTAELSVEPVGDHHRLKATFTGAGEDSTYSVLVYNDGVLQGGLGGFELEGRRSATSPLKQLPAYKRPPYVHVEIYHEPEPELPWWWWWIDWGFSIAANGGCNWGTGFAGDVSVVFPNGMRLVGDEIRLEEEVRGPGHYPYLGFESIVTRTSSHGFTIIDEVTDR